MTKQIKVSDETYNKLKYLADEGFRTLGGEIDYLVSYFAGEIFTGKINSIATQPEIKAEITEAEKIMEEFSQEQVDYILNSKVDAMKYGLPVPNTSRTGAMITAGITALTAEIDDADVLNQDPDYWDMINEKKARVQKLWAEWHLVTGR